MEKPRIIAAAYSPMMADKSINVDAIQGYSDYLQSNKISGVFINGSTGDFPSLTKEERKQITQGWSKYRTSEFEVLDHIGHTSLKIAKELATYASDKVDGIAAIAPYYFKPHSIDKLLEYCVEIAQCAPNVPFYYYHLPVLTGVDFSMGQFIEKAASTIPNFKGIKFTHDNFDDFSQCKDFKNSSYDILFGYDEYFVDSLNKGASSWVGSTYNHLMPLYNRIYELSLSGKVKEAQSLQSKVFKFVDILNAKGGYNGVAKGLMKYLGVDCGPSRYPHNTASDEIYVEIQGELQQNGLLEFLPIQKIN